MVASGSDGAGISTENIDSPATAGLYEITDKTNTQPKNIFLVFGGILLPLSICIEC